MSKPRFLRDTTLYALSGIATKLIGALLLPILTRLLTPAEYGIIDLITLTMAVGLECIILGTDYILALYYHDDHIPKQQLIGTFLFSRVVIGITISLIGIIIVNTLTKGILTSQTRMAFSLACLTLPSTAIINNWLMILRQQGNSGLLLGISIGKVLLTAICTVGFIYLLSPIQGYFTAFLIVDTILAVVYIIIYRHQFGRPIWSLAKAILQKGVAFFPRSVYFIVMSLIARQMLLAWSSLEEVGYYTVAIKVSYIIWIFISASSQSWLAYSLAIAKKPHAYKIYAQYLEFYMLSIGFLTIAISLFAPEILMLLTTPEYLPAAQLVGWQALSLMAIGSLVIVTTGLNIIKETKLVGIVTIATACFNIGIVFLLVPRLGSLGVALASAIDQILAAWILYYVSQKKNPLPYRATYLLVWGFIIISYLVISFFIQDTSLNLILIKILLLGSYTGIIIIDRWKDILILTKQLSTLIKA